MTTVEKIETVQTLVGNDKKATAKVVRVYLLQAEQKILDRLYALVPEERKNGIPEEYDMLHCELTARLWLRRGGEAELRHSEAGIDRIFGSTDDGDVLDRLTPYAKVM